MDLWTAILIQLGGVLLGFILGLLIPRPADSQWYKNYKARKAIKKMVDIIPSRHESGYRWNAFEVENVAPIFNSLLKKYSINKDQLNTTYVDTPKKLPPDIQGLHESYLPIFIDHCADSGQKCHNDGAFALDQITINRSADEEGRVLSLDLRFSSTDYFTFAMSNMALDKPLLESGGRHLSIRQKYNLFPEEFNQYKLESIPLHLRFGTNTVVLTKENLVLLPVRSQGQAIDTGGDPNEPRVHVVGEGMLRPVDSQESGDGIKPEPFLTVKRALEDEFNVDNSYYALSDIKLLSIFFDFERYQPIALFTVKVNLSAGEFEEKWQLAKDRHEHVDLAFIPYNPEEIRKLLEGKLKFRGNTMSIASKHAKMSLFLTLFHYHDFGRIKRAFEVT